MYVSQGVFFPGTLLILERNLTWDEAKDVCWTQVKPNWVAWTLFALVVGLVGASGALLCFVGVLFTAPIAMIAMAYAYEKTFGASPAAGSEMERSEPSAARWRESPWAAAARSS